MPTFKHCLFVGKFTKAFPICSGHIQSILNIAFTYILFNKYLSDLVKMDETIARVGLRRAKAS